MSYTLVIPVLPSNPNRTRGRHWSHEARERKEIQSEVWAAWAFGGKPMARGRRARLEFVVAAHGRADDADNRLARMKKIIDALTTLGVIVDDSPHHVDVAIPTRVPARPGSASVSVTITYEEPQCPSAPPPQTSKNSLSKRKSN